ncbi:MULTISPECIES: organic hydroperoxide resistance protein [Methylobacterium]|uniref:Organic hydroperoxide resistance protein n=1 Tax=Methylobacterium nonmethylotrophicum TaxID=1141884 RepID=A0A4Z0NSS7_9HYPH|nr:MULTISPECIES: organic hydroperoxide resistance protein [Methylobacterium]QRE76792.1 organic hydroperoxide resistance protein [Methylobacterium aquaticum]TGD99699.1 organic hydroperoxide resistance protein [Methylobacterium nonmethylotrophicum]
MNKTANNLYTAHVHTVGGREGTARSLDGRLDVRLSRPGSAGEGTNPEQLFAAGWSACFEGAMVRAARTLDVTLPQPPSIDAEIGLNQGEDGFFLSARLTIDVPGLDRALTEQVVEAAHRICPYSKATRGQIDVVLMVA